MWKQFIEWLKEHAFDCFFRKYLGFDCFGCGMQRAILALLKGDILGSIKHYPALLPMLGMFIFLLLHLKYSFKRGALVLLCLFIISVVLIVYKFVINFL